MKKLKIMVGAALVALTMTSCGAALVGVIYEGDTQPVAVTSNVLGKKVGTAKCASVLGIAAYGNAGISEAAKNGNITKISHIDRKTFNVLGVYTEYEYFVYGE
jgi:hypothetical protein